MWAKNKHSGFTIVELLIVVVVIAILATISVVAYNNINNRARGGALATTLSQAAKKLQTHTTTNNDTLPADQAAFSALIPDTTDTTFQYTPNTTIQPNLYCITATTAGVSSHIASGGKPTDGPCTGHTGISPTVAANGEPCPPGFIVVPGSSLFQTNAFCVMKYEAKIQGQSNGDQTYNAALVPDSRNTGTPWVNISQANAMSEAQTVPNCNGCHLITENEWLTIAHNALSVPENWSGGAVGNGSIHSGHSDNSPGSALIGWADSNRCYGTITAGEGASCAATGAQQRTLALTNGQMIWDFAGNVAEWTSGTIAAGKLPGLTGDTDFNWRQYNNPSMIWNGFPDQAKPRYGTAAASDWTSSRGIGQVFTYLNDTTLRAFYRGGYWAPGSNPGVLSLHLARTPSYTSSAIGFRAAR